MLDHHHHYANNLKIWFNVSVYFMQWTRNKEPVWWFSTIMWTRWYVTMYTIWLQSFVVLWGCWVLIY